MIFVKIDGWMDGCEYLTHERGKNLDQEIFNAAPVYIRIYRLLTKLEIWSQVKCCRKVKRSIAFYDRQEILLSTSISNRDLIRSFVCVFFLKKFSFLSSSNISSYYLFIHFQSRDLYLIFGYSTITWSKSVKSGQSLR